MQAGANDVETPAQSQAFATPSVDSLIEAVRTLSCMSRFSGPREVAIAKKDLAHRESRIMELEDAVRKREKDRLAMVREHETLAQQLSEARELMQQLNEARGAWDLAERRANDTLGGSTDAQESLSRELQAWTVPPSFTHGR